MSRNSESRVSAPFAVVRAAIINVLASQKPPMPTQKIAEKLGINRSYVIRLQSLSVKPVTPAEKRIAKAAAELGPALQRLGMGFIFKDDIVTTLAGGERPPVKAKSPPKAKPKAAAKSQPKAKPKGAAKPKAAKPKAAAKSPPKAATKSPPKVKPKAKPKAPKAAPAAQGEQPALPIDDLIGGVKEAA